MNALTTTQSALPAHLAHLTNNTALMAINDSAMAGVSLGGGHPRISIKGSRFRLQQPQGEEMVVPTLDLDVIVLSANPHGLSKIYYAGAYDPSVDDKKPDCYSDNGVGPSSRSEKPQCGTCAACPHNVWGSRILPSGAQGKACADSKKLAVLLAGNPDGPVFELRVPAASLSNWGKYVESLNKRGIPAAAIITKLTFDTAADFPKLVFTATNWADEAQGAAVMEAIESSEVEDCTGAADRPVDPAQIGKNRTVGSSPQLAAPVSMPPIASAASLAPAPQTPSPAPVAQAQQFAMPAMPPQAAPLPETPPTPISEKAKRPRKIATVPAAGPTVAFPTQPPMSPPMPPVQAAPVPATPAPMATPMFPANVAVNAAQAAAPLAPAATTTAALDDLINQVMGT